MSSKVHFQSMNYQFKFRLIPLDVVLEQTNPVEPHEQTYLAT
jgi:hypothetical protein